ncbi:DUF5615 family PIN-like protein [Bythopirellula polymerisocia]|uniref:DUF5615 family PIN-like protein n=1 Tax=Bythopirellula polymerisocia TaxID=2528003 RepID=UPI0018D38EAA|nr:DUF5615 family PIN-like protein [Bythopirellula polymerisocia]
MIRYLLDENVPHAIAHGLRQRGVEVVTASDVELLSVDDELIVEYAVTEGYVVFTQDDDFLRIHSKGEKHAGIVYSKQGKRTLGEIIRYLKLLAEVLESDEFQGQLEYY